MSHNSKTPAPQPDAAGLPELVQKFVHCNGMGAVIVEGPRYAAVCEWIAYAQQAVAQQEDVWVRRCNATARERDQYQARAENYTRMLAIAQENGFETVSDAIDQALHLRAEVKRLNEWADTFTDAHLKERQTGDALLKEKQAELDQCRAQSARDRQDAERYRWLKNYPYNLGSWISYEYEKKPEYESDWSKTVEVAIDAAIAKEQKHG